jgi:phosphoglycolate phosphatase
MPPRPSVLLWDWDNTLADGWLAVTAALNATFAGFAMPAWTVEETRARAKRSLRESFPPLFGAEWERARALFLAAMRDRHLADLRPMPGALAALEAGRAWPQGVVSNKDGGFVRAEVGHLGWAGLLPVVIGAGDATADKPDPAPILLALERMGAAPGASVWYVGDTALDMRAARAAGCTAVLVGDAAHDEGLAAAAPDHHWADAHALAGALVALA